MQDDLQKLRIEAAALGKWNIGYFASGAVFWIAATIIGQALPLETARLAWFVGTFFIFPLAVLFSRLFGADPFMRGNALGELVGYTHMSVIAMTLPIILACVVYWPEAVLLVMAIAYCLDFYVMSWAFGTRLFGLHAAVRVASVALIWFAFPHLRFTLLPALVACLYLGTVAAILTLRPRWLAARRATLNV